MGTAMALLVTSFTFVLFAVSWRILNWIWLKPRQLEKLLREQGFSGNPYRVLFGDMKDSSKLAKEAMSKPIDLSDNIAPRVQPFVHQIIRTYGIASLNLLIKSPSWANTDLENDESLD